MPRRDRPNTIVAIILLAAVIAASIYISGLWIVPGPEGLDAQIAGVYVNGKMYTGVTKIDDYTRILIFDSKAVKIARDAEPLPPHLLNCKGQPGICEYGPAWWYDHDGGELVVEISRPQLIASFTPPSGWREYDNSHPDYSTVKEIEWVNTLPNGTIVKRVGYIVPAEFVIQIFDQEKRGYWGLYRWKDIDVWIKLYGVVWEPYDPNPPTAENGSYVLANQPRAYVLPLMAWVEAATPWVWENKEEGSLYTEYVPYSDMKTWLSFYPDKAGREFTLYTEIGEPYHGGSDLINADNPLKYVVPDPRLTDEVYIKLHIGTYGPFAHTECGWWIGTPPCCTGAKKDIFYPASYIKVKVLTLVWGEFKYVWTAEEAKNQGYEWDIRGTIEEFWSMGSWVSWLFIAIIIVGVLLILLALRGTVIVIRR